MRRILSVLAIGLSLLFYGAVSAQTYYFNLEKLGADIYIDENGIASIEYSFVFLNNPSASPIEYVDIGMPNDQFSLAGASAEVNGQPVIISKADYEGNGSGFAVVLGSSAIAPGRTGTVHVFIPNAGSWLRFDSKDNNYASIVFSPTWFDSSFVKGRTQIIVSFHLPPGIQPEEPRWHAAPEGWPKEPQTSMDDKGRVTYTWVNSEASATKKYLFGASFPTKYLPENVVRKPSFFEMLGISPEFCFSSLCCGGIFTIIIGVGWWNTEAARRRKLNYLPPKISIEGLGIKRGLTAVEAGILMEQPLDKVLTMVLFGIIKKGAATVRRKEPLELEISETLPEGLNPYEVDFLNAFKINDIKERRKALQTVTIDLVQTVSKKMKGFSRKETIAYYKDIIEKAWKQVEAAQTPEVKSETFDRNLEWTMLDKGYDDRTREVFQTGPVFLPNWWGRFDPAYHRPTISSTPTPSSSPREAPADGGVSLPSLPGGAFAASMVKGVQNFSSSVIGNVQDFTSTITSKTNPLPVSTTSRSSHTGGGGGGCACACACACAGCACACAGGGR